MSCSYENSAVLDIQCVVDAESKYFIKEMSVIDIDGAVIHSWMFKHSAEILRQNMKSRRVNGWLKRNYHQLSYEDGDVDYREIEKIINSLKFTRIFVKGEQKQNIINSFLSDRENISVIDTADMGCPPLRQLKSVKTGDSSICCIYHKDFDRTQCTLYKVMVLRKWLVDNI